MALRKPTPEEMQLLEHMVRLADGLGASASDLSNLAVENMSDGGMGSLRLFPAGTRALQRFYGRKVSTWEFADDDDVPVLVALIVDAQERLYELELWKSNHGRLGRFPEFASGSAP